MIHAIIVPAAIRDACNRAAHDLGIDPVGDHNTLSVPLVPSDGPADAAPTHWGACGHMPDQARLWLAANLGLFPDAAWWRIDHDNRLQDSSHPGDNGKYWDWNNCLAELNLQPQRLPLQ